MHRREILAAGAASMGVLSGCTSGPSSDPEGDTSSPDGSEDQTTTVDSAVFKSVGFEGKDLVVEINQDADVTQVNILDETGELVTKMGFTTGATRASRTIKRTLETTWEFVAVKDGEALDSTTIEFAPDIVVTDFHPRMSFDEFNKSTAERDDYEALISAKVTLKNSGNAPFVLGRRPFVTSGVPQPFGDSVRESSLGKAFVIGAGQSKELRVLGADRWRLFRMLVPDDYENKEKIEESGYCQDTVQEVTVMFFDESATKYERTIKLRYSGGAVSYNSWSGSTAFRCKHIEKVD